MYIKQFRYVILFSSLTLPLLVKAILNKGRPCFHDVFGDSRVSLKAAFMEAIGFIPMTLHM